MPVLEGVIDNDLGAIADVVVRPSTLARSAGAAKDTDVFETRALFDTGADVSIIQTGLAARFGLVSHDIITIGGLHERSQDCQVYDVDLCFDQAGLVFENVWVAEADLSRHVGVIIGRSVLRKGEFSFNGWKGTFSLTLR